MTNSRPMVDTNILVYAHNQDLQHYKQAGSTLRDLIEKGGFCVSSLVLLEFFSVITNGRKVEAPLSPKTALNIIDDMLRSQTISVLATHGDPAFFRWLNQYCQSVTRYQIYDASIAFTMHQNNISELYTNNTKDFRKFDFIKSINPFATSAMPSAPCALRNIPYGRQSITEQDVAAVCKVLRSDWLTQGPTVPAFERAVADYCGARHAVAVNSATSALHIACLALDVGPGDWVWTSPTTFVASANCALYCGARVDFVDIDPRTYNMSVERLAEKLMVAKRKGQVPKVVIPVHLCGQSCDMAGIHTLAQEYGFKVIEDASHAIGGKYKNEPVGNCRYSDITVFSFHPVKIITTGEGGMALTNDAKLADRLQRHRSHGITSAPEQMQSRPAEEIWNYQQVGMGYNYRMTDIQAALGLSQIARLDEFVNRRHQVAEHYDLAFADLPVITPWQHPDTFSSYHLYPIRVRQDECGKTQRQIYAAFWKSGVRVNLHYIPVYRQPYYEAMGFKSGYCPESEKYHKETISLPIFPTMTDDDVALVVESLRSAVL